MRPLEECRLPQRLPRHRTYLADKNPQEDQKQGKQPQHSNNKLLKKNTKMDHLLYLFRQSPYRPLVDTSAYRPGYDTILNPAIVRMTSPLRNKIAIHSYY